MVTSYNFIRQIVLTVLVLVLQLNAAAAAEISVVGRIEIVITKAAISFGDVAEISASSLNLDEAIIGLRRIPLGAAPKPGESVTLSAHEVLQKLTAAGVNLNQVRYSLPTVMTVKRAFRELQLDEVKELLTKHFATTGREITLTDVAFAGTAGSPRVSPDAHELFLMNAPALAGRSQNFLVGVRSNEGESLTFAVRATIEEWLEVDVTSRTVAKGSMIDPSDFVRARMRSSAIPADAITDSSEATGLEVVKDLSAGEILRKLKIQRPRIVDVGSRVTAVYRSGAMEITLLATALSAGAKGDAVRVRNENSKQIVFGTVMGPGLVEVSANVGGFNG